MKLSLPIVAFILMHIITFNITALKHAVESLTESTIRSIDNDSSAVDK